MARDPIRDTVFGLRHAEPRCWHIHASAHPKYQRHLNSYIKTTRLNHATGRTTYFWKQLHKDDHLLDCECMVAVRAIQFGLYVAPEESPLAVQQALF